jgi:hypothetical protein
MNGKASARGILSPGVRANDCILDDPVLIGLFDCGVGFSPGGPVLAQLILDPSGNITVALLRDLGRRRIRPRFLFA